MKLLGVMSLQEDKNTIKELFKEHQIQLFSELNIAGHTSATIKEFGWFTTKTDLPYYSTLCFAIIPEDQADTLMSEIGKRFEEDTTGHPIRAFQVDVERMI
jgi:hypothetical protein